MKKKISTYKASIAVILIGDLKVVHDDAVIKLLPNSIPSYPINYMMQ